MAAFGKLFLEDKMFPITVQRGTEVQRAAGCTELGSARLSLVTVNKEMTSRAAVSSYMILQKTFANSPVLLVKSRKSSSRIKRQTKNWNHVVGLRAGLSLTSIIEAEEHGKYLETG